jgi:hypothetical protein
MARKQCEQRETPQHEPPGQKREEREQAGEEEQAVHAPVDPVEEHHPRRGSEERGDDPYGPVAGETAAEECDQGHARDREDDRDHAQRRQPAARVHDRPGEEEVQRRAAALADNGLQDVAERAAPDEESERLVLVRRPRVQEPDQDAGERAGHDRRRRPEELDVMDTRVQADTAGSVFHSRAHV